MALTILDKIPIENFVIENNIIKGVHQDMTKSYQIGKLLFEVLDSKPDHVFQIQAETEESTTFAEMKENSVRCALWLKKQGIGSGDIVTICSEHYFLHSYIPILATFYVGATHNAWHEGVSLKDAQHLIRTFQPKIIFVTREAADVIVEAGKIEDFQGKIIAYDSHPGLPSLGELMQQQTNEEIASFKPKILTNPEDIAYIILTSGSTGFPKGATHSYGNVLKQIATGISYAIKGALLTYAPWYWINGFLYSMRNIFLLGTKILHRQFDPEETSKVIEKYKVELFRTTATALYLYCKSDALKKYQLKSLKLVIVGGSKTHDHILDKFRKMLPHVLLINSMGASEMGRMIVSQTEKSKAIGSAGFIMSDTEIKICDLETKEALGPNKPGELCVKSSLRSEGYYNDEANTKAAFDNEGWFYSGDVAYYDENGEFFIIDRKKEIMKYRCHQVSPNEIEDVLLSHPEVLEASVLPVPHEVDGDHAMAFVKKLPGSKVTEEELVKLSECLGEIKKLHGGVKFIDDMPKVRSGKINRQMLKQWVKIIKQSQNGNIVIDNE